MSCGNDSSPDHSAFVSGELRPWPSKDHLASALRAAGLRVYVGQYCVRIEDCSHFVFQQYGGDICEPSIEADADSPEAMVKDAKLVSDALERNGIKHRFDIYDGKNQLVAYLHHEWPM